MVRFNLDSLCSLVPAFHTELIKQKRRKPPGRWRPRLNLSVAVQQNDDSDQWEAWLNWTLFSGGGDWPCRLTAKHESISPMDPPDGFKTRAMAEEFAEVCMTDFREQYNIWILKDFSGVGVVPDRGN
jgi:hypothetical protein